jgi:acetyl-CoA C-acetyltransferase
VRDNPAHRALVGANGGLLSKYSVGVYGSEPTEPVAPDYDVQRDIDSQPVPAHTLRPEGWATIETYTVVPGKSGATGVVVGRLDDGARFLARTDTDDPLLDVLQSAAEPIGERFYVTPHPSGNRATRGAVTRRLRSLDDEYECVRLDNAGHVLTVTMTSAAFTTKAHAELAAVFDAYFADDDLWAAVLICAESFSARDESATGPLPLSGFGGLTSRTELPKPVIAAVHGSAVGRAAELALACHLVVADADADFTFSHVRTGTVAGSRTLRRLARALPPHLGAEFVLTGRRLDASEAHRLGLVNRVVPVGQVAVVARHLAAEIVAASPTSVRLSLAELARADAEGGGDPVARDAHIADELLVSDDAQEARDALAAGRPPLWRNR